MSDQTIGEIPLGEKTKLIFSVSEWRGRQFAGVRKFIASQKYEGWTKAGLSMPRNLLHILLDTLAALERTLPPGEEHEFRRIPKGDTEYLQVTTLPADDDGLPLVDVREFVDTPRYQGPTKRGFRFRWNLLPDVLACFRSQLKIIDEVERKEPSLFGPGYFADPGEETQKVRETTKSGGESGGIVEILGDEIRSFPADFLDGAPSDGNRIMIPEEPLRLNQDNAGNYHLGTDECVFCAVRNPAEGNFIIYAQMRGHKSIVVPKTMIHVFKSVKAYENYIRSVQTKLISKVLKQVSQRSVAEYEARKKMADAGLPWLASE